MKIFGAGMAGLLAGNMLRRHTPKIYEAQSSLPNNHAALLRFRTDRVSKVTGIPFKKVIVRKLIKHKDEFIRSPRVDACNAYSYKVTGKVLGRSIWNLDPVERYIAPLDFITQSSANLDIEYDGGSVLETHLRSSDAKISTIPMPILMQMSDWKDKPEFEFLPIWSLQIDLGKWVDVYQTIYYSDIYDYHYRASITGSMLIIEFIKNPDIYSDSVFQNNIKNIISDFGICHRTQTELELDIEFTPEDCKFQKYGKLLPIDEKIRKEFILAMTDKYNIYSLGRFATWRQILMDDIVQDVNIIEKFITERDSYKRRMS